MCDMEHTDISDMEHTADNSIKSSISSLDECEFCLCEKDPSKDTLCVINCGHTFHYSCVQAWIQNTKDPTKL